MKYSFVLFLLIIGCSLKHNIHSNCGTKFDLQIEKSKDSEDAYVVDPNTRDSFELFFMSGFNDQVVVKINDKEIFNDLVKSNELDFANVSLSVKKNASQQKEVKTIINDLTCLSFSLSEKYAFVYLFKYNEELIVRYSNSLYEMN